MNSAVFIVLSLIHYSENALSYSKVRSRFSPEERAAQTQKTISSIREKAPGAKIVLVEIGQRRDLPFGLSVSADRYIYLGDKFFVRLLSDGMFKGLGEAVGLFFASKTLRPENADIYFKLSGRYFLTDNFKMKQWFETGLTGRSYGKSFSTRLYAFDKSLFGIWRRALILSIPWLLLNRSLETVLLRFFPKDKVHLLPRLGVAGQIGVTGEMLEE